MKAGIGPKIEPKRYRCSAEIWQASRQAESQMPPPLPLHIRVIFYSTMQGGQMTLCPLNPSTSKRDSKHK